MADRIFGFDFPKLQPDQHVPFEPCIPTFTDGYKLTQWRMYPHKTKASFAYWEARPGARYSENMLSGLQYLCYRYFTGRVITPEWIDASEQDARSYIQDCKFNRPMWEYLLEKYGGYLPIRLRAVPEGLVIPVGNVLMTLEPTCPDTDGEIMRGITGHMETVLQNLWFPSTVGTISRHVRLTIKQMMERTCDTMAGLPFMLHDFGMRGAGSPESAAMGGAAHLINFLGSDTLTARDIIRIFYNDGTGNPFDMSFSVNASEHSNMTSLGREGEKAMIEHIMDEFPTGILSQVIDSYDVFACARDILGRDLRDKIMNRQGVFVARPDSGDPVSTMLKLCNIFGEKFGVIENSKGYKLLPPYLRVLWGDGLNEEKIYTILREMANAGWSAGNVATFGMGGGLLHAGFDRDTQRFAFKCSAQLQDGQWVDIFKDPVDSTKSSKKGRLMLVRHENGQYETAQEGAYPKERDILQDVLVNGRMVRHQAFQDIRALAV